MSSFDVSPLAGLCGAATNAQQLLLPPPKRRDDDIGERLTPRLIEETNNDGEAPTINFVKVTDIRNMKMKIPNIDDAQMKYC